VRHGAIKDGRLVSATALNDL